MDNIFGFTNKEEAKNAIYQTLTTPNWKQSLCKDINGNILQFDDTKEFAIMMNEISSYGWFNDNEKADGILHICIYACLDDIAEWLIQESRLPLDIVIDTKENVGAVLNENKEETQTSKVKLSLKKEIGNKTDYGFYVSFFHPVL